MSEHVIALDPGGRSGWASARMSTDRFEFTGAGVLRQDLMANWLAEQQGVVADPSVWAAENGDYHPTYDVVVYESWKPRRQNGGMEWIEGDPLLSAQHVGQVRWIALASGARLVEQHPSDKPMAVQTMPKKLADLDSFSIEQHDQDARMHLWLYFFRQWFTATMNPEDTVFV